ncbi:MAG: Rrf2 family transcriptional regulator [Nitrospira sp.]
MKVSHRAIYGIMAAVDLAMHGKEAPVQARAIARRQGIPVRFLEQVLHTMRKAGLVESVRGAQGGYLLLQAPSDLSVAEVLEVLEGPIFHGEPQNGHGIGRRESKEQLLLGTVWTKVQQAEQAVLGAVTIDQLVERQRAIDQQQNPMYHI